MYHVHVIVYANKDDYYYINQLNKNLHVGSYFRRFCFLMLHDLCMFLVPNLYPPICTKTSDCRGKTCISSHINVGQLGTLEYNSFRWCAICLFNQLPLFVRNTTVCSIHSFKKQLDSYLSTVPDSSCLPGFNNIG